MRKIAAFIIFVFIGLILLRVGQEAIGITVNSRVVYLALLCAFIVLNRGIFIAAEKPSTFLKKIGMWALIFLFIITVYAFKPELNRATERVVAAIIPSYVADYDKDQKLTISRSNDGHFYLQAQVNNRKIIFMVDTGASDVALSAKDAKALGFDLANLKYTKIYYTANGITYAAPVKLAKVTIGPVSMSNVKAHVNQGGLDISLLGMSLISRFKSFKIDGDLLILEY